MKRVPVTLSNQFDVTELLKKGIIHGDNVTEKYHIAKLLQKYCRVKLQVKVEEGVTCGLPLNWSVVGRVCNGEVVAAGPRWCELRRKEASPSSGGGGGNDAGRPQEVARNARIAGSLAPPRLSAKSPCNSLALAEVDELVCAHRVIGATFESDAQDERWTGKAVSALVNELLSTSTAVLDLPAIDVALIDGTWYALSSRRLVALQMFKFKLKGILAADDTSGCRDWFARTYPNGKVFCRVVPRHAPQLPSRGSVLRPPTNAGSIRDEKLRLGGLGRLTGGGGTRLGIMMRRFAMRKRTLNSGGRCLLHPAFAAMSKKKRAGKDSVKADKKESAGHDGDGDGVKEGSHDDTVVLHSPNDMVWIWSNRTGVLSRVDGEEAASLLSQAKGGIRHMGKRRRPVESAYTRAELARSADASYVDGSIARSRAVTQAIERASHKIANAAKADVNVE
ncbi:unnamed protein product [Vitrella brassicaformis CCMP3155]|uniref:Uncharacterized protein n=3 Tax=Vitrella brassicaformis TaxID=1169539 RepID=A0A0G4H2I0_VITBC|nr:unnamed protein product [Vitrella brassicaformis CCMP3155]|eukprot:CEM37829.1 unnamed protein product [Vitrella brassicaformis CCMP3155]